jgi:hypothetical protein
MTNKWTRTASFRFYNTEPRNPNWSWSAVSPDGKTVVVTLWIDGFKGPAGSMVYARRGLGDWHNGNGNRFFFEDLAWAVANCGGIVRVIVAVRDKRQTGRGKTVECYPRKELIMRVVHLDPKAGAFRLKQVAPNHAVRSVVDSHVHSQAA